MMTRHTDVLQYPCRYFTTLSILLSITYTKDVTGPRTPDIDSYTNVSVSATTTQTTGIGTDLRLSWNNNGSSRSVFPEETTQLPRVEGEDQLQDVIDDDKNVYSALVDYEYECLPTFMLSIAGCPHNLESRYLEYINPVVDTFENANTVSIAKKDDEVDGIKTHIINTEDIKHVLSIIPYTDVVSGFQYKNKTIFDKCNPTVDSPRLGIPWGVSVLTNVNLSPLSLSDKFRVTDLDCASFIYPFAELEQMGEVPSSPMCQSERATFRECKHAFETLKWGVVLQSKKDKLILEVFDEVLLARTRYMCNMTRSILMIIIKDSINNSSHNHDMRCMEVFREKIHSWGQFINVGVGMTFYRKTFTEHALNQLARFWTCFLGSKTMVVVNEIEKASMQITPRLYRDNEMILVTEHKLISVSDVRVLDLLHKLNEALTATLMAEFHTHLLKLLLLDMYVQQNSPVNLNQRNNATHFETAADKTRILNPADVDSDLCFWLYETGQSMPEESTLCMSKLAYLNLSFSNISDVKDVDLKKCISLLSINYTSWFVDSGGSRIPCSFEMISVATFVCIVVFE